jgi:CheY-like chemotaxis protein
MRILFLDDMEERHELFQKLVKDTSHFVVMRRNVEEAVKAVEETDPPFDMMFLDHDLADEHYPGYTGPVSDKAANGTDFVKWLVRDVEKEKWPSHVVVHSWNPDGKKRMAFLLADFGIPVSLEMFGKGLRRFL